MRYLLVLLLAGLLAPWQSRAAEDGPPPREKVTYEVPYRLTDTKHVLVRIKLNGKGPFNFIIDTGAPALIMTEAVAEKVGGKAEKNWIVFDKLEIEGGITIPDSRGVAIDMFQLKGMNSMGFAGVELHGVIGYNILAKYRIQYDFTETKLRWTPVDFKVPEPKRFSDEDGEQKSAPGSLEMIGDVMRLLAAFGGVKPNFEVKPRGFLGAELAAAEDDGLLVKSVLKGSPAEKSGLQAGDRIEKSAGTSTRKPADLLEAIKALPEGSSVKFTVRRGDETKNITVELGKGL